MVGNSGNTEMQVLLTGSTGFLGRRILRELVDQGCLVRCAVRPGSDVAGLRAFVGRRRWNCVETSRVNLTSFEECCRLVEDCHLVFHSAAALSGAPSSLITNTVVPTRTLMAAAAEAGVNRFVLVSSLGVYGPHELPRHATLDESCPLDSSAHLRDAYTYSKVLQEEVAKEVTDRMGLPLVVVRPGVIFGDERGALSHRIGLKLGNILLRMGGRQLIPFTYVENCAAAIVLAGLTEGIDGSVFNVVDDDLPSGIEVLRRHRRAGERIRTLPVPQFGIKWLARFNESYSRRTEGQIPAVLTRHRVEAMWKPLKYSNERARKQLGWSPAVSFDEALDRTLAFGV